MFLQTPVTNIGDFFTTGSFATLLGCTTIVLVVSNGIQSVFNFSPRWLALLISLIVSLIAAYISKTDSVDDPVVKYLMAVLNAFLIHASATGVNQMTKAPNANPTKTTQAQLGKPQATNAPLPQVKRTFNSNWWN